MASHIPRTARMPLMMLGSPPSSRSRAAATKAALAKITMLSAPKYAIRVMITSTTLNSAPPLPPSRSKVPAAPKTPAAIAPMMTAPKVPMIGKKISSLSILSTRHETLVIFHVLPIVRNMRYLPLW